METELKISELREALQDSDWFFQNAVKKLVKGFEKKREEFLENVIRGLVAPPIKGKLTGGKLRWRGITITRHERRIDNFTKVVVYQVFQRGKQIGPDCEETIEVILR